LSCLDDTAVLQLIEGTAAPEAVRAAEAHIAECAECRQLVSEIARSTFAQKAPRPVAETQAHADGRAPGDVIFDRYQLERMLGEGGMGEVWAARHLLTRRRVALKFIKDVAAETDRRRLYREARAQGAIDHPNVVRIHDLLELPDGSPVLVMDLLQGRSLREHLHATGALPAGDAARLLMPVVSALGAAHALGIVHRDLKPENIYLVDGAAGPTPMVLDFGVAKLTAKTGDAATTGAVTGTGEVLGTPYYMSPEQVFGERDLDHRTDVWALGVILFECLQGERPFRGDNVGQVFKGVTTGAVPPIDPRRVPDDLALLIRRMLTVDRSGRPEDLRAVAAVLEQHTKARAPAFGPARFLALRQVSTRPLQASIVVAAIGAALAASAWWFSSRAADAPVPTTAAVVPAIAPARAEPIDAATVDQAPAATQRTKEGKRPPKHDHPARDERLPGGVVDTVPF
jgi:serine/threonine-protein kinase